MQSSSCADLLPGDAQEVCGQSNIAVKGLQIRLSALLAVARKGCLACQQPGAAQAAAMHKPSRLTAFGAAEHWQLATGRPSEDN
jgi:hypothetical protein